MIKKRSNNWLTTTSTTLLVVSAIFAPTTTFAVGIKAAPVEQVIPSKPFFGSMILLGGRDRAIGPNTGVLGVTSITITNFNTTAQQVLIFAPVVSGADCNSSIIGGSGVIFNVYVQPTSTLQLNYPSPLVFNPVSGITCIAAQVTTIQNGSVQVVVNGIVN